MNNLYIYPDTKYAGDVNEFFTEPHCANTAVSDVSVRVMSRVSTTLMDGAKCTATTAALLRIQMYCGSMV